jgi:hypothetical protein
VTSAGIATAAAAIVGGLTGLAALVRTFIDKPKIRADAMATVNAAALSTMNRIDEDAKSVRAQMGELRALHERCEQRIDWLEEREDLLVRAIRLQGEYISETHQILEKAGLVPPPKPFDPDEMARLLSRPKLDGG